MAASNGRYSVEFTGNFAILWMKNVENRFNISSVRDLHNALDQVESNTDVKFLIITGEGKFFSNGLDLDKIVQLNEEDMETFLYDIHSLHARILTFPLPTIAALNGHTYAGGATFALCHDYRIMRTKQGWFCLPEINLRLRFSPLMTSIINAKILDSRVKTDAVIMGKKYTAEQALEAKLVDQICENSELLDTAITFGSTVVGSNNWDRKHMSDLKKDIYWNVFEDTKMQEEDRKKSQMSKL